MPKGERTMKGLRKTHIFLAAAVLLCLGLLWAGEEKAVDKPYSDNDEESEAVDLFNDGKIRLIIRLDDIGFCHAANLAFEKIANEGCVTAVSLMVTTGWLDEAVDMLKAHPEVSVGV
ncbi:MAG TPA: ChbG/HpnK family deacetylase, partial [Firmicutes bacterium]|nr:ChbG/HpnK family deacetylase [Bacillota bacterium]